MDTRTAQGAEVPQNMNNGGYRRRQNFPHPNMILRPVHLPQGIPPGMVSSVGIFPGTYPYSMMPMYRPVMVSTGDPGVAQIRAGPQTVPVNAFTNCISAQTNARSASPTTTRTEIAEEFLKTIRNARLSGTDTESCSGKSYVETTSNVVDKRTRRFSAKTQNDQEFYDLIYGLAQEVKHSRKSSELSSGNHTPSLIDNTQKQPNELADLIRSKFNSKEKPAENVEEKPAENVKEKPDFKHEKTTEPKIIVAEKAIVPNLQSDLKGVVCKYGSNVDGYNTYSFDDFLKIRDTFIYDKEKMINLMKKYSFISESRTKHANTQLNWRGFSERKQLGQVSHDELFRYGINQILNKLNTKTFETQIKEFTKLLFDNADKVKYYAKKIYDKIIFEQSWLHVYCSFMVETVKILQSRKADYATIFNESIREMIFSGLQRDFKEEKSIADSKKITSTDVDEIDRIVAGTVERENTYRKKTIGLISLIGLLYDSKYLTQEDLDQVILLRQSEKDSFGIELLCKLLNSIALNYMRDIAKKKWLFETIDGLNEIISSDPKSVTNRCRYTIMDLYRGKEEKFSKIKPMKPLLTSSSFSKTPFNRVTNDKKRGVAADIGASRKTFGQEVKSLQNKNDTGTRMFNSDVFNNNKGGNKKTAQKGVSMLRKKLGDTFDVPVEELDANHIPKPSENRGRIAPRGRIDLAPKDNFNDNTSSKINVSKPVSIADTKIPIKAPTTGKTADTKTVELTEAAETMIEDFYKKDTNVSRFMITLGSHSLVDHLDILLKVSFKYYSGLSHGFYTFGILLTEIMRRFEHTIEVVRKHILEILEELPLNALDEPYLWNNFFLMLLPMMKAKVITFDEFYNFLVENDEVSDSNEVVLDMFTFASGILPSYELSKIFAMYKNSPKLSIFTKHYEDNDFIQTILKQTTALQVIENTFMDWNDLFLAVGCSNTFVSSKFKGYYTSQNEGINDLAKCLYFYANKGDEFTNDLIRIFELRSKEFFESTLGSNAYETLLKSLGNIFYKFKFSPNCILVDVAVPIFKNNHIQKSWLSKWRSEVDDSDLERLGSEIFKITKSLN